MWSIVLYLLILRSLISSPQLSSLSLTLRCTYYHPLHDAYTDLYLVSLHLGNTTELSSLSLTLRLAPCLGLIGYGPHLNQKLAWLLRETQLIFFLFILRLSALGKVIFHPSYICMMHIPCIYAPTSFHTHICHSLRHTYHIWWTNHRFPEHLIFQETPMVHVLWT